MANFIIADDSMVMRTILQFLLEKLGHKVVGTAKDGNEAVVLCGSLNPDAIVLDVTMKGADGLTALQEIKRAYSSMRIFMAVESWQTDEVTQAKQMGADGFLQKPFALEQVTQEVERAL